MCAFFHSRRRMFSVHSRSCVRMWATSKACPTSLQCSSCTSPLLPSRLLLFTCTTTPTLTSHVTRHASHVTRHALHVTRHTSRVTHSYSDTPFDAFVAFSNVIVRPFFQNFFKRREVCRTQAAFPYAPQSLHLTAVCCACNRSICRRDTMLSSSSSAVRCSPIPRPSVANCSSLVRCRESSGLEPQVRRQAHL